jgi:1-acyl-sn-glycerol-3-phosphate acyltransferase
MFYLLQFTAFILLTIVLSTLTLFVGVFDRDGKHVYRINQLWSRLMLKLGGIELKVDGLEQITADRQYIFMVNHQSNVDIPVLVQALPQFQLRWIAKKELLWVPFFGWAMWATKHITVDRSDPLDAVRSIERAQQRIAAGISVVVFPEGTRSRDGKLLRFKKGGFLLAVKTHTAIVPVTINGSRDALPANAWRLKPGTIKITVDQPVAVEGYRPGNLRLLAKQVQETIAGHLEQSAAAQTHMAGETVAPLAGDPTVNSQQV